MTEKIGNIVLDYTHYPGVDLYCDGNVEDELLDIVRQNEEEAFRKVIEDRASWPIFYHLSPLRGNIVDWIPVPESAKVLEVGSGCGAITGTLAKKAGSVTCIDLSKKRSLINAFRHKEAENVMIHVGNFKDIEKDLPCDYDYIFLIGVFEYGHGYMGTKNPYVDFMRILKKHLKQGGRIIIAIENKFGLKYWAGCKEDHLGTYYSGIEDYPQGGGVRTFTRNGLEKICREADCGTFSFYYPYPDYKFMTALYSDVRLPKTGELSTNLNNFDRERLLLLDEKNAFDSIIKEELFPLYANSYVLVIGEEFDVKYAKFSNDRAESFAICTKILGDEQDGYTVRKSAVTERAEKHIADIERAYHMLSERYAGSRLSVNRCQIDAEGIALEYLDGRTLEEVLDECLECEDEKSFEELVNEFERVVAYGEESGVTDYDLIFGNILITGEKWTLLDYEWTFQVTIPARELVFRALYCYSLGSVKRKAICDRLIHDKLGYSGKEVQELAQQEVKFQKYVTGEHLALVEMRHKIGNPIIPVQELAERFTGECHRNRVQIYEDCGGGYSEAASYFLAGAYTTPQRIAFTLELTERVKQVRIDPAMESCLVLVKKLILNGEEINFQSNGCLLNGDLISPIEAVFATQDPNISLKTEGAGMKKLEAVLEIVSLPMNIAEELSNGIHKKRKRFWQSR